MHRDIKKRRFALPFDAGDLRCYVQEMKTKSGSMDGFELWKNV